MLLALPQPGPAGLAAGDIRGRGASGLKLEHRAQAQPQQARTAHAEDVAPGHAKLRITKVFPWLSGDDDHRGGSLSRVGSGQKPEGTGPSNSRLAMDFLTSEGVSRMSMLT